jgi:hypothetical protein
MSRCPSQFRGSTARSSFVTDHLSAPHGGKLVNLMVDEKRAEELKSASRDFPSWDLSPRQLCDLELLLSGGFSLGDRYCRKTRSTLEASRPNQLCPT